MLGNNGNDHGSEVLADRDLMSSLATSHANGEQAELAHRRMDTARRVADRPAPTSRATRRDEFAGR